MSFRTLMILEGNIMSCKTIAASPAFWRALPASWLLGCMLLLLPAPTHAGSIKELSFGGVSTDTTSIKAKWTKATGTVAGGADLTVGGVLVPGVITTVPAGEPITPLPLTIRYGFNWRNKVTFTNTPSFTFDKPSMGAANQVLLNSISQEARSPVVNPTDIAIGTASSTQTFDAVGAPVKVDLAGSATVTLTGTNTGKAAFFADDPITVAPQSTPFLFNQQITSLGLSIDGVSPGAGLVGVEYDAYSSLVPTTDGSLGLLYRLGFSLSSDGEFDDCFFGAPLLGFTSQSQIDSFLTNLVASDLKVTTGPNPSVSLLSAGGFLLFPSAIPIDISAGAVLDFNVQSFAQVVPEPPTLAAFGAAMILLALVQRRRLLRH
jgi:hypothetical protein